MAIQHDGPVPSARPSRTNERSVVHIANTILLGCSAAGLVAGLLLYHLGRSAPAGVAWATTTALVLAWVVGQIVHQMLRRAFGVDVIAAMAMAGALLLGQYLAGAVIAVMFSGGGALEEYARARARRELSALLGRAPKFAHRIEGDALVDVPISAVRPGDDLIVKGGEIVPTDGILEADSAVLDESALTGESVPVKRRRGDNVRSGCINGGPAFELRALARPEDSTFATIVRLVQTAQESKAPFVRLADRYAVGFLIFTVAIAGIAYAISGDGLRALAVLVVATPCPLILAAPVAFISGISRAARHGVLIKSGSALEALAQVRTLLIDKTGTLTAGRARVISIEVPPGIEASEILRLAASLDQASQHLMAAAMVDAARERGLSLVVPARVNEEPGTGIAGTVDDKQVMLGGYEWVHKHVPQEPWVRPIVRRIGHDGTAGVFVAVDGKLTGVILLADEIRPEAGAALRALRAAGLSRVVMVTGDRPEVAESIGAALGIDAVLAQRTPEDKLDAVAAERAGGVTMMVGDGINDGPALAAADVGVAVGTRGGGSATEAADVVLLVDRVDRLADAVLIARRARSIAVQSVLVGMGLSIIAMGFAALGHLPPIAGAILQEAIDVVVIVNALRALRPLRHRRTPGLSEAEAQVLHEEHHRLKVIIDRVQGLADAIDRLTPTQARRELIAVDSLLRSHILPHERNDDATLYPRLAKMLGGEDPMASMSRSHREILHLARLYERTVADIQEFGPDTDELREVRRTLYGLVAVLRLHFAQEEELFHSLSHGEAASTDSKVR